VDATASARPTHLGALVGSGKSRQVETVCGHPQHVYIGGSRDCGQRQAVFVFNIARNRFRLIATIHFNQQRTFTLRFLTHAEYGNENWKREL